MSKRTRELKRAREEHNRAAAELGVIQHSINDAYTLFNNTSDPALLDACIYEINALRARYDYALLRAKRRLAGFPME